MKSKTIFKKIMFAGVIYSYLFLQVITGDVPLEMM